MFACINSGITCRGEKILAVGLLFLLIASFGNIQGAAAEEKASVLKVGAMPIMDCLPLFVAIEKGYFKAEGLKVEFVPFYAGSKIIAALAGGSVQVGFGNVFSLIMTNERGFDFVIVADDAYIARTSAVVVRKNSGINRMKDLEGKTVAVPAIKQIGWVYIRELVSKDGGNLAKVNWIEIPPPHMAAALLKGQVEAAEMFEPFVTVVKEKHPELKLLSYYLYDLNPGGILAPYFASKKWIKGHTDLVKRFARAHKRGVNFVNTNPNLAREILPKYTRISPELAKKVPMVMWKNKVNIENLQWSANLALKHGLIGRRVNAQELVYQTAR